MKAEIEWSDTPPTQADLKSADLRRCPCGGLPAAIILSEWLTGNELHWWNGRSFPHLANDCPACAAKRAKVWKGYLACLDPKTRKIFILEITPNCTEPLSAYKLTFGSLRGATLKLDRSSSKPNGRVTATVSQSNLGGLDLPQPPDIRAILRHMWQTDHRPQDDKPENTRAVTEAPMSNEELRKRRPDRFATEGHAADDGPMFERHTLDALKRNREAAAAKKNGNGAPHP